MKDNLPIKDENILEILAELEIKLQLLLGDDLVKIVLYGSYARNEQDSESDMDIMVLVNSEVSDLRRYDPAIVAISVELAQKYDVILSIILKNYAQFQYYLDVLPFYMNVQSEGIPIYG